MASTGSRGLRRLGLLATGLGLALVAVKARRESRDGQAPRGSWAGPSVETRAEPVVEAAPEPLIEFAPDPVVEVAPEPVAATITEPVAVAPEPVVVEVAPEPIAATITEPVVVVVEVAPEPVAATITEPVVVVEVAPEPVAAPPVDVAPEPPVAAAETDLDVLPAHAPWEMRAKARIEQLTHTARRHRRALIAAFAVVLAVILLVAVPTIVRNRDTARWERCVERTTGTTLPRGGRVTRVVLDDCGPKPATNRLPADRRN